MRRYLVFGEWVLKQAHRNDKFGEMGRLLVSLNDPVIASKHRDDLYGHLRDVHNIPEDILWFIDFDMFYDEWIDNAGWQCQNGTVYLLKAGSYYKIGVTQQDVQKRIAALQTGNPETIILVASFFVSSLGGSVLQWEKYFHARYRKQRANGEWFALSKEDTVHFQIIGKYCDYLSCAVGADMDIDDVLAEIIRINDYNQKLVGKRVHFPKGTLILSPEWEPTGRGYTGRVIDYEDNPGCPCVCVRTADGKLWIDSKNVRVLP